MAKSSGKSTKKSGNTKKTSTETGKEAEKAISTKANKKSTTNSKKKSKKKSPSKKETGASKKTNAKKQPALKCQFCHKTMIDQKTLKIHERNCQAKKDKETEKKLDVTMLRMKDDFEDERKAIIDRFSKREDALQNELDEIRTVLRMEIDRHRKELDMINNVKKQAVMIAENLPEPPSPEPKEEAVHAPHSQPKAIDMIPIPLPDIPKKIIGPRLIDDEEPSNTVMSQSGDSAPGAIPTTDLKEPDEVIIPPKGENAVIDAPEPSHAPLKPAEKTAESVPTITGLSKEEVKVLVKSIIRDSASNTPASGGNTSDLEELKTKVRQTFDRLDALDSKVERFNNNMEKAFEKIEKKYDIKKMEKELGKVSEKIFDMMEDIGFSEDLNVTKIPPTILEIVYQATLDDIHFEMVRTMGTQDAEKFSRAAIEDVRQKTSGSELFMFNGRKIVTDNLARSIEANLISAKQIQTTYDVLLERLLEAVPHHKAKNFRGMIKVKSQEFAVDRATVLTKEYARMSKIVESSSQMIAAMSAQASARNQEIHEALDDIKNNLLTAKASTEDIEFLRVKLQEQEERDAGLDNDLALLKAEIEMKEQIKDNESEDQTVIIPGETIDVEATIEDTSEIPESKIDVSQAVLKSIQNGAGSKTAIIRETNMEEDDILNAIAILQKDKKVIEKKIGKRIKYLTPEQDINEKLETDGKKNIIKKKEPAKKGKSRKVAEPSKIEKPKKPSGKKETAKKKVTKPEKKDETKIEKSKKPAGEKETAKKKVTRPEKKDDTKIEKPKKPSGKNETTKKKVTKPEKKDDTKIEKSKKPPGKNETTKKKATKKSDTKIEKPKTPSEKNETTKKKVTRPAKKDDKIPDSPPGEAAEEETSAPEKSNPKEEHVDDELPVITKKLEDLSDDEHAVLDAMTKEGMTISGIQSKVGKGMKRFALLRALRVLIDSGYVGIITKGRMDLYQKINVKKMDKNKQNKTDMEVN